MGSRDQRTVRMEKLHKGFRFRPTDEELVDYYLRLKIDGRHSAVSVIPEIDILKWEPWDLPALSVVKSDDPEWLYFWARDKKYPTSGYRSNRATGAGYWKATGKDRPIKSHNACSSSSQIIGLKKTLVFYMGRAPRGERTNWVMHEYRRTEPDLEASALAQVEYVLCRLFHKADERLDNSKPNEVECNESLPSDDISADVVEEAGDIEVVKEAEDVRNEGWTDQADDIAFDGIDHSGEETATEVTPLDNEGTLTYSDTYQESLPLKEISISEEFGAYNEFDDKAFYNLSYYDFEPFLGSPFAADFGNESNELHFQDGTFELDPSLSDLLQSLQNQDPTGDYNACETFIPSSVDASEQAPITTMCEAPISTSDYAIEEDYFVNEPTETPYHPNSIKDDTCPVTDTGIKICSHEPRDQSNSTVLGTAPTRIRLSMGSKPKSINRDISEGEKHASSPPLVPKESHDADGTGSEDLESAEKKDSTSVKNRQNGGTKTAPCVLSAGVPGGKGSGPLKVNPASIYLAMILSVVFFGVWICPRLQPQYG